MQSSRIDALIASAFNLAASEEPTLRSMYPNGMSPAIAAGLPMAVRVGWVESYAHRLHGGKASTGLFTPADVQSALDTLNSGV